MVGVKRSRRLSDPNNLVGKRVVVPKSVWPTEKVPRNQRGWEAKIVSKKRGREGFFYVLFKNEKRPKYYFDRLHLNRWVIEEDEEDQPEEEEEEEQEVHESGEQPTEEQSTEERDDGQAMHDALDNLTQNENEAQTVGFQKFDIIKDILDVVWPFSIEQQRAVLQHAQKIAHRQ